MGFSLSYESILNYIRIILDILAVWFITYQLIKIVRTSQKTIQIFQGVVIVIAVQLISQLFGLTTVNWLANNIVSWGVIAVIVIFQPEIRSILERLGTNNALARISTLTSNEKEKLINELMTATTNLAASKTGALITLEQSYSLSDYVNTGIRLNSLVTAELICSIFMTTTPLHDGAIIIQGDKMSCASAYFPPTSMDLPSRYGARHRAAIGISEITDSVTIVVSEETGRVAVAEGGRLIQMNEKKLRDYLNKIILNKEAVRTHEVKNEASVDGIVAEKEDDFKASLNNENNSGELNLSGREMKLFKTTSFKVGDVKEKREKNLVESVINNTINENTINDNITVKKVAVPKDNVKPTSLSTIKTESVTTGTASLEKVEEPKEVNNDEK